MLLVVARADDNEWKCGCAATTNAALNKHHDDGDRSRLSQAVITLGCTVADI